MNRAREAVRKNLSTPLQLTLLVLTFLVLCAALLQIFSAAWKTGQRAERLNAATQLCRSAAEAFAEDGSLETAALALGGEGSKTTLYFDEKLDICERTGAVYRLDMSRGERPTEAGTLATCVFSAGAGGEELYRLEAEVYLPDNQESSQAGEG
ncbi:MAG: hypothetical protein Q4B42_06545 [Oscillospiraceae bacterium]|nr:hypothetical protein [Oscillospiraceae bacterium]